MKKNLNVGLIWHSLYSDNLGVGALTLSQVKIINEAASELGVKVNYFVWGTQGGKDYSGLLGDQLIKVDDISLREILTGKSKFSSQLNLCDILFDIGEGDSFSDIYGMKRFLLHVITKYLAYKSNRPLILSPQTIGPYKIFWSRYLAKLSMSLCRKVFARDELSFNYLKEIGAGSNAEIAIDVAFELPYQKKLDIQSSLIKVGLNVSGLLYNGGYSKNNMFGLTVNYQTLIHQVIEGIHARGDAEIYLIPHVTSEDYPVEDDYGVCEALQRKYPFLVLAPKFSSPSEAKSYIAAMNYFTGARMHSCIAAFSSGVPVIPMSYSRKFNGLFETLGYTHLADCLVDSNDQALTKILSGIDQRNDLALEIATGNSIAQQKLMSYKNYIKEVLITAIG